MAGSVGCPLRSVTLWNEILMSRGNCQQSARIVQTDLEKSYAYKVAL